jgi:hypothetical protein
MRRKLGSSRECSLYSMDYSKYDRTIPDFAIDMFFSICRDELILDETDKRLYNMLRYYTKYSPIGYNGELYFKRRGISSGSLLTNLLDSWWNLTLWNMSSSISNSAYLEFLQDPDLLIRTKLSSSLTNVYPDSSDICVCGDDVLIYTTPEVVITCINLCKLFDMDIDIKMSTNHPAKNIFFLGRFWDRDSAPIQSELYMVAHAIFRTKFYNKDDLPLIDISNELDVNRLISIFCPFRSGFKSLIRIFGSYPPLVNFFKRKSGFYKLGDWRTEKNIYMNFDSIYSWRHF